MKKIFKFISSMAFAAVASFGGMTAVEIASDAGTAEALISGTTITEGETTKKTDGTDNAQAKSLMGKLMGIAKIFAGFVLAVSVIVIVYGGLKYVLSQGDSKAAEQGKMLIIYSGIGIFVALSAFIIIKMFIGFA